MSSYIDLSSDYLSSFEDIRILWGNIGFVSYCVNNAKGPSQSFMMVLPQYPWAE